MNDLVQWPCNGDHPVEVTLRPEPIVKGFKDYIGRSLDPDLLSIWRLFGYTTMLGEALERWP